MSLHNLLSGADPTADILLRMLDLDRGFVGRFLDCFLTRSDCNGQKIIAGSEDTPCICIYTRIAAGKYQAVLGALQKHPDFLYEEDDSNSTCCAIYFKVPAEYKELVDDVCSNQPEAVKQLSSQRRFLALIDKLRSPIGGKGATMAKYRKKPVVVEATQWFKNGDHPEDNCRWIESNKQGEPPFLSEGQVVRCFRRPDVSGEKLCAHCQLCMHDHGWIDTPEGGHIVCPSDWIITGVAAERYPCKDAIFQATYEPVAAPKTQSLVDETQADIDAPRV